MTKRNPYKDRSDLEKIKSQWHKLTGLHSREEWSAAVVRAATAAEVAANLVIRKEFASRSQFDAAFVDCLLRWANGLRGKFDHLLLPLFSGQTKDPALKELTGAVECINKIRNDVVHKGIFCNESEAHDAIAQARKFVETLVRFYEPHFALMETKDKVRL